MFQASCVNIMAKALLLPLVTGTPGVTAQLVHGMA